MRGPRVGGRGVGGGGFDLLKLSELVVEGAILPALVSNQREAVVRELLGSLVVAKIVPANVTEDLVARVMEREKRGSTGFGRGVAVPHVKHAGLTKMAAAIGLSSTGVDFASLDRQPVHTVFLLLSPEDRPEDHLKAMEVIFKNLSKDTFRRFLRQAQTVDDVRTILIEADSHQLGS